MLPFTYLWKIVKFTTNPKIIYNNLNNIHKYINNNNNQL